MKVGIGYTNEQDALVSGKKIAEHAIKDGDIRRPDLVFAFCSGELDHDEFFRGLRSVVGEEVPIIGGSSVGIITNDHLSYEGYPAAALVLQFTTVTLRIASAGNLDKGEEVAGRALAEKLSGEPEGTLLFLLYDSIKVPARDGVPPVLNASSPLLGGIEQQLQASIPIIGAGLVGDYALRRPTKQFCGLSAGSQRVVGTLFAGDFKPYFRIMHGCTPLEDTNHTITKIDGSIIYELDGKPIVELIDALFGSQDWRNDHPVDLLTIGRRYGSRFGQAEEGDYVNRLITGALPNGEGVGIFEPDFEEGTEIQFMLRDTAKMVESAKINASELMEQIKADGKKPLFGMYIDCAGRAAKYLNTRIEEATEVQKVFNHYSTPLFGFYSGVEIAPLFDKSRGLDWTGVLMVLAEG